MLFNHLIPPRLKVQKWQKTNAVLNQFLNISSTIFSRIVEAYIVNVFSIMVFLPTVYTIINTLYSPRQAIDTLRKVKRGSVTLTFSQTAQNAPQKDSSPAVVPPVRMANGTQEQGATIKQGTERMHQSYF